MSNRITRREVLKQIGSAGAGVALGGGVIRGQGSDITIGGKAVEIVVTSISPETVRIGVLPLENGTSVAPPDDGGVAEPNAGKRVGAGGAAAFKPVRAGNLVVKFVSSPPAIQVETASGAAVQRFTFD